MVASVQIFGSGFRCSENLMLDSGCIDFISIIFSDMSCHVCIVIPPLKLLGWLACRIYSSLKEWYCYVWLIVWCIHEKFSLMFKALWMCDNRNFSGFVQVWLLWYDTRLWEEFSTVIFFLQSTNLKISRKIINNRTFTICVIIDCAHSHCVKICGTPIKNHFITACTGVKRTSINFISQNLCLGHWSCKSKERHL